MGQGAGGDLVKRCRAGLPLERSSELKALASRVANRHAYGVAFDDAWVERLAGDLARFTD